MITVRELAASDLSPRGENLGSQLCEALAALSPCGYDERGWLATFKLKKYAHQHVFIAFEYGKVVGTATLAVDPKFSHGCGLAARAEDVSVRKDFQGLGVGKALMDAVVRKARNLGAYKLTLECKEGVVPFYESCGMERSGASMRVDLE